jgi:hypothetical protein
MLWVTGVFVLARWFLFASSYSPLVALASLRFKPGPIRSGAWILAGISAGSLVLLLLAARRVEPRERVFVAVQDRGGDVAGYLATYLLPFLVVPQPTTSDLAAYGGYMILAGLVYTRSSLVAVNPLLYVFGYRLFSTETTAGDAVMLVGKAPPKTGVPVPVRTLIASGLALRVRAEGDK